MRHPRGTLPIVALALATATTSCVDDMRARQPSARPAASSPGPVARPAVDEDPGPIARGAAPAPAEAEPVAPVADDEEQTQPPEEEAVPVGPPDPIEGCEELLDAAGLSWSPSRIPLHETRGGITCGAPQVVRVHRGPGQIFWDGKPKVTCGLALAMARLERIVQEEAQIHLGHRVVRVRHMGTYNCREMANYPGWVSEHSYANAIDIKEFVLRGGGRVSVLEDYPRGGGEPQGQKARFLRAVARRLFDEEVFSVVLTPSFDRAHRNHFHLDLARYRVDGV